jgi:CheY-like chemotaxis protein
MVPESEPIGKGESIRVLVVDDDAKLRSVICRGLAESGIDTQAAGDAEQALT